MGSFSSRKGESDLQQWSCWPLFGYLPIPKIDVIGLKPLQTPINRQSDILRIVLDLPLPVGSHLYTELCREEYLIRILF